MIPPEFWWRHPDIVKQTPIVGRAFLLNWHTVALLLSKNYSVVIVIIIQCNNENVLHSKKDKGNKHIFHPKLNVLTALYSMYCLQQAMENHICSCHWHIMCSGGPTWGRLRRWSRQQWPGPKFVSSPTLMWKSASDWVGFSPGELKQISHPHQPFCG